MPIDNKRIRELRIEKGLTQQQAADAVGFSNRQVWYQLEAGILDNITVRTLETVAKVLGVKAKELLK